MVENHVRLLRRGTGSVPAMPPAFNIGSDRVMDSTGALLLQDIPSKLLVIGGGTLVWKWAPSTLASARKYP